jgi:hypothetical protein
MMRERLRNTIGFKGTVAIGLVLVLAVALAIVNPTNSSNGSASYEPNDTPGAAAGPVQLNRPYVAAIEGEGDRDHFEVVVPRQTALSITVRNLGGGQGEDPTIEATVQGIDRVAIDTFSVIERAHETKSAGFRPGRYVVLITSAMGHGEAYSLSINGIDAG